MHSVTSSEQIAAQPHPEPSVSIEPDGFVKALQNILGWSERLLLMCCRFFHILFYRHCLEICVL